MGKKYDLAVVTGTYQKDGETKKRYENIGVVMENDNGMYMLLKKTFNPAGIQDGKESIIVSMFEPKPRSNQGAYEQRAPTQQQQNAPAMAADDFDDDILF